MALTAYQRHMKRELKGKMKGKTKAQRKAIFRTAARKWKSPKQPIRKMPMAKHRVYRRSSRKSSKSSSRGSPSRRSRMRSFLSFNKIKGWIQKIALVAPAAFTAIGPGTPQQKIVTGLRQYTGFDPQTGVFQWTWLLQGWGPFIGSVVATEGISLIKRLIKGFR